MIAVLRRRHARTAVATLCAWSLVFTGLAASSGSAVASIGSDQTDIAHLEQQIAAQGAHEQALVSRYNEAQAHLDALNAQIAHDQSIVAADQGVEADATSAMQRLAVEAYTSGSKTDSTLAMFSGSWSVGRMLEQNQYLDSVNTKLSEEITALHLDVVRTHDAQHTLRSEQAQATQTLAQVAAARDAATTAIAADEAKLSRVKGDLRVLLAAANARRQAEQVAAERALAAAQSRVRVPVPPPAPSSIPPPVTLPAPSPAPLPASSGYANPLRAVSALTPERIDQGVDYSGFGPIYAIGNGVVLNTVGGGWPGGTFIAYQLTDGPARGLVVYAAEDIQPSVQVGATVTSNTVIGQVYEGPSGIETGWANGSALPDTMARDSGQFNGSDGSAFGYNFSRFLQSLGAPGGIETGPPTGALPAGWPVW